MKKKLLVIILIFISINMFADEVIRTIDITGRGEITVKPDTVVINTGVDSGNPEISIALRENNRVMNQIFKELNRLGIKENDIKTSYYNVNFYTPYKKVESDIEEYRVSNSIEVMVRNIGLLDKVIDSLIDAGANKISGISFTYLDSDKYKKNLTTLALSDAREKAEFIADQEGLKITGIISISENGSNSNPGNFRGKLMAADSGASVAPGSQALSISLNVVYQVEPK